MNLKVSKTGFAKSVIRTAAWKLGLFKVPDPRDPSAARELIKKGTLPFLNKYAKDHHWKWNKDQSMFGGYWSDLETGDAYLIDVIIGG